MDELLDLTYEDAKLLGCEKEVLAVKGILKRGTSAHCQLKTYESSKAKGSSPDESLKNVVDQLIAETAAGL